MEFCSALGFPKQDAQSFLVIKLLEIQVHDNCPNNVGENIPIETAWYDCRAVCGPRSEHTHLFLEALLQLRYADAFVLYTYEGANKGPEGLASPFHGINIRFVDAGLCQWIPMTKLSEARFRPCFEIDGKQDAGAASCLQ